MNKTKILKKLELLNLYNDFSITKQCGEYEISENDSGTIMVVSANGDIRFFVNDIYNSGSDYAEIDIDAISHYQKFIEMLQSEY